MQVSDIAERLRFVFRLMTRRAQEVSGKDGPTRSELDVMVRLDEHGAMTPSALAAATGVRPQTMGQTLDLLDRHDWTGRAPHPSDRRQVLISLSRSGREALRRGRALRQAWLVSELEDLSARDRQTVADALVILERIAHAEAPSFTPSTS